MRAVRHYGRHDSDIAVPNWESFKHRAQELLQQRQLRLCDRCLRRHRRCYSGRRGGRPSRSWKEHRDRQHKYGDELGP